MCWFSWFSFGCACSRQNQLLVQHVWSVIFPSETFHVAHVESNSIWRIPATSNIMRWLCAHSASPLLFPGLLWVQVAWLFNYRALVVQTHSFSICKSQIAVHQGCHCAFKPAPWVRGCGIGGVAPSPPWRPRWAPRSSSAPCGPPQPGLRHAFLSGTPTFVTFAEHFVC